MAPMTFQGTADDRNAPNANVNEGQANVDNWNNRDNDNHDMRVRPAAVYNY